MKLADLLNRRQYSLRWFKKQNEIVKYKPEGYNERGVYTLDEWTDYSCVGHFFSRKKLFSNQIYSKTTIELMAVNSSTILNQLKMKFGQTKAPKVIFKKLWMDY